MPRTKSIIGAGTTLGFGPVPVSFANEVQTLTITGATGGTFTLTFDGVTTAAIAYNASAATMQTAIQALATIGAGNLLVTGAGPFVFTGAGALAGIKLPLITVDNTNMVGGSAVMVETTPGGGTTTYTLFSEVTDVKTPKITVDKYEATHYTSADLYKEFLAGWKDGGEVSWDMNYIFTTAAEALVGVMQQWQINIPDAHAWTFLAFIDDFEGELPNKGKCAVKCKMKVSGPPQLA